MLTLSNKKIKRQSDLKSALIIGVIIAIVMTALAIWGDLS